MCATICGRFRLNDGGIAGYVNRMKAKYTAKCGVQSHKVEPACGKIPYEPVRLRE